jgi:hypothetical protein
VNPGFLLVAERRESPGFFARNDSYGELIGGLLYVLLPMVVAGLFCRLVLHLWTARTGRRPPIAANPLSAAVGVFSYFVMAIVVFASDASLHEMIKLVPNILIMALFITWPVLAIMGPILYFCLRPVGAGGRRPSDLVIYVACLACAFMQYWYMEEFLDF